MYLIFKVKYFRFMQNADTNIFYLLLAILSALVLSLRELYHYSSNFNTTSLDRCMIAILSLWWWIVFVLWLTDERHCQRSSPSRISDTPRAGFQPAQNLSSGLVEWSCAVVITTKILHQICFLSATLNRTTYRKM